MATLNQRVRAAKRSFNAQRQRIRNQRRQIARSREQLDAEERRLQNQRFGLSPRRVGQTSASREAQLERLEQLESARDRRLEQIEEQRDRLSQAQAQLEDAEVEIDDRERRLDEDLRSFRRGGGSVSVERRDGEVAVFQPSGEGVLVDSGGQAIGTTERGFFSSSSRDFDVPSGFELRQAPVSTQFGEGVEAVPTTQVERTERVQRLPPAAVTEAPGFSEFRPNTNPVLRGLAFVGERTQGAFGRLEPTGGQSLAGTGAISTGLQIAPFANPITGPAVGFAAGAAQFVTPSGRRELSLLSPRERGERIALSITGLGLGGVAAGSQAARAAGFPRFRSTEFTRVNIPEGTATTNVLTTQRGLFGNRQFASQVRQEFQVTRVGRGEVFSSVGRVGTSEILPRAGGVTTFTRPPTNFAAVASLRSQNLRGGLRSTSFQGFTTDGQLRAFTGQAIGSQQGGFNIGVSGIPGLRGGRGFSAGTFGRATRPEPVRSIVTGSARGRPTTTTTSQEIRSVLGTQATSAAQSSIGRISPGGFRTAVPGASLRTETRQRTQQIQVPTVSQAAFTSQRQRSFASLGFSQNLLPNTRGRQGAFTIPALSAAQGTSTRQGTRSLAAFASPQTSFTAAPIARATGGGGFGIPFITPRFRQGTQSFNIRSLPTPSANIPSFGAFAFGVTGRRRERPLGSLTFQPIFRGFGRGFRIS